MAVLGPDGNAVLPEGSFTCVRCGDTAHLVAADDGTLVPTAVVVDRYKPASTPRGPAIALLSRAGYVLCRECCEEWITRFIRLANLVPDEWEKFVAEKAENKPENKEESV